MFIGEKIIYLELHKAGSSHVRKILDTSPSCHGIVYGKHETIYDVPKKLLGENFASKIKAGSVRNPWDSYVSLWAYGCMGQGGLHGRLTSNLFKKLKRPWIFFIPAKKWAYVYSDATNPKLFRQWLKMILSPERKHDMGEGYGSAKLSSFAGFLTYRYIHLHTYDFDEAKKTIKTYNELVAFDQQKNMLDFTIKCESIEKDLEPIMLKMDIPLKEIESVFLKASETKSNPSVRKAYREYYDDETRDLVYEKEKFLIEKYNYQY